MSDMEEKKGGIPLYTKVGWAAAWVVMAVIVSMILHNCVNSVYYGSQTSQAQVDSYYEKGRQAGLAGLEQRPDDPAFENPVLRKSFNKGYRDGLDLAKGALKGESRRPEE